MLPTVSCQHRDRDRDGSPTALPTGQEEGRAHCSLPSRVCQAPSGRCPWALPCHQRQGPAKRPRVGTFHGSSPSVLLAACLTGNAESERLAHWFTRSRLHLFPGPGRVTAVKPPAHLGPIPAAVRGGPRSGPGGRHVRRRGGQRNGLPRIHAAAVGARRRGDLPGPRVLLHLRGWEGVRPRGFRKD